MRAIDWNACVREGSVAVATAVCLIASPAWADGPDDAKARVVPAPVPGTISEEIVDGGILYRRVQRSPDGMVIAIDERSDGIYFRYLRAEDGSFRRLGRFDDQGRLESDDTDGARFDLLPDGGLRYRPGSAALPVGMHVGRGNVSESPVVDAVMAAITFAGAGFFTWAAGSALHGAATGAIVAGATVAGTVLAGVALAGIAVGLAYVGYKLLDRAGYWNPLVSSISNFGTATWAAARAGWSGAVGGWNAARAAQTRSQGRGGDGSAGSGGPAVGTRR